MPSDLKSLVLTTLNNKYKVKVSEIYDGELTQQARITLAKDILIINTASSTDKEKSPYVNYYYSEDEDPILCRVLYDKNDLYGLQIISVEPLRKVKLGYDDDSGKITGNDNFEKAMNSYNRAIETLNEYAESYMDTQDGTKIVKDARCVGSDPRAGHKNDESTTIQENTSSYGTVNLKDTDTNYLIDEERLQEIGLYGFTQKDTNSPEEKYWLASRITVGDKFYIRVVTSRGYLTSSTDLCKVYSWGSVYSASEENYLRPIFSLNSEVRIKSGNGTIDSPYELEI